MCRCAAAGVLDRLAAVAEIVDNQIAARRSWVPFHPSALAACSAQAPALPRQSLLPFNHESILINGSVLR
jgi:hypothetical protein